MKYEIHTDGACSVGSMYGGYAAIVTYEKGRIVVSGCKTKSTNNEMEILAVIMGLSAVKTLDRNINDMEIIVYSDSAYVVNCINEKWYSYWISHDWTTRSGSHVKNKRLWKNLLSLIDDRVSFVKVKGHSTNVLNKKADKIAVEQRQYLKTIAGDQ